MKKSNKFELNLNIEIGREVVFLFGILGFDNYYKIIIRDLVCEPKF